MTKEEKRVKVLKSASDCFARYGFEKTTLDDIGKAVGLNKASLYYYYKNKESIFCDVIATEAEQFLKELQRRIRNEKTAEGKIQHYLKERINYYRSVVNLHNLSMDMIRKVEPVFLETYEKVLHLEIKFLNDILNEGIVSGEFQQHDAGKVAEAILNVAVSIRYREVHNSIVKLAAEADYHKIAEEIKFVTGLLVKGIRTNQTIATVI